MIGMVIETKQQLDNMAWDEFLKRKDGNAKYWYDLRRRCKTCNIPILDDNATGYCKKCGKSKLAKIIRNTYRKPGVGESKHHLSLKEIGRAYLENKGCINIGYEKKLGKIRESVEVDVYGELNGQRIAVECGGSTRAKLHRASRLLDIIYILPYGDTIPYEWSNQYKVCNHCGHKMA